jgi:uncharacterized protein (TIGR03435 family)
MQVAANTQLDLEFEVATIKSRDLNQQTLMGVQVFSGGRIVINAITLDGLVQIAFHLAGWQISDPDKRNRDTEYNIEAKPSDAFQATHPSTKHALFEIGDEHLRTMLQNLLIERFHLAYHWESRPGTVYVLDRSGKTLALHPAGSNKPASPEGDLTRDDLTGDIGLTGGYWSLHQTSMAQLARFISTYALHSPVSDQTGLHGAFNFTASDPPIDLEVQRSDFPGCVMQLVHDLGLELHKSKGEVRHFVIDHAENPDPN